MRRVCPGHAFVPATHGGVSTLDTPLWAWVLVGFVGVALGGLAIFSAIGGGSTSRYAGPTSPRPLEAVVKATARQTIR